jgi:anti-anti-sigma factor
MKSLDSLKIEQEPGNQLVLLRLTGTVDAHTFDQLESSLDALFQKNVFSLVVDMAGVRYASSAGIGVFIGALAKARQEKGDLVLMNISPEVLEVFDILGLTPMFFIAPDIDAAAVHLEKARTEAQ